MQLKNKAQGILYGSLFLLFALQHVGAQTLSFSKQAIAVQEKFFLGEPISADLAMLKTAEPNNLVVEYLQAQDVFFKQLLRIEEGKEEQALKYIANQLDAMEDAPKGPWRKLLLAELHLMRSMLRGREKSYLGAAWDLYKGHDYLHQNKKEYPTFEPSNVLFGMMEAILGSIPDDYRFYAELVGMDGSLEKGMAEMKRAVQALSVSTHPFHYQYNKAAMLYAVCRFNFFDDRESSLTLYNVPVDQSPVFAYAEVSLLQQARKMEKVQRLILRLKEQKGKLELPYLDFILARTYMTTSRETAIATFKSFLKRNNGPSHVKATHRYLYWMYALEGKWEQAEFHKKSVLTQGEKEGGADKQAEEDVNKPFNASLVQAQLLFDNGQYVQGIALLQRSTKEKATWSKADQRSYHYRLGRLYGESGQLELAKLNYSRAVSIVTAPSFERGNSLLQLGVLEEKLGNGPEAAGWYKQCLKEKGFPYEDGIHFKAKTGLKRLKK